MAAACTANFWLVIAVSARLRKDNQLRVEKSVLGEHRECVNDNY